MISKIRLFLKEYRKKLKKVNKAFDKFLRQQKRRFTHKANRKFFYAVYSRYFKLRNNQILIESFHGRNISDSGLVLAQDIIKLYPNRFKIYFASEKPKEHQKYIEKIGLDVELIDVNTFKYTKIFATSKYLISNVGFPVYFNKRKGQRFLETWHGTPLKTLGKKMTQGALSMDTAQHSFLQADFISEPNDFTHNVIMEDYNLENIYTGKVIMSGYPRNKIFMFPEEGVNLKKKLGLNDKTVYAYMPTWRGTSVQDITQDSYATETQIMFKKLDKELDDNTLLYVKFHPLLRDLIKLDNYDHIKQFPDNIESYEFLNCCDALITDYSSVFFDYSLTKKPVILFMYDYDEYMKERGLIFDVKSLPFYQVYDLNGLIDCMKNGKALNMDYSESEYFNTFLKYDRPDSSEKLVKLLIENDESDLKIIDYSHNKDKKLKVLRPTVLGKVENFAKINRLADENTVVWFDKPLLAAKTNCNMLYENFNESFDYIISANSIPRTYLEDFLMFFRVPHIVKRIQKRNLQRNLPNLNIKLSSISDITDVCFIDDEIFNVKKYDLFKGDFDNDCKENEIKIKYTPNNKYDIKYAVIAETQNQLITARPLTQDETNNNYIKYNVTELLENGTLFCEKNCFVGLLAVNKVTNKNTFITITNDNAPEYWKNGLGYAANYYFGSKECTANLGENYFEMLKLEEFGKLSNQDVNRVCQKLNLCTFINKTISSLGFIVSSPEQKINIVEPAESKYKFVNHNEKLEITFEEKDYLTLENFVILDTNNNIIYQEPLDEHNYSNGKLTINIKELVEKYVLFINTDVSPAIVATNNKANYKTIVKFTDSAKYEKAIARKNPYNKSSFFYKPASLVMDLPMDYFEDKITADYIKNGGDNSNSSTNYNLTPTKAEILVCTFYNSKNRYLKISIKNEDNICDKMNVSARTKNLRCKKDKFIIDVDIPSKANIKDIAGARLQYRSKTEKIFIPLETKTVKTDKGYKIRIIFNVTDDLPLKALFWDFQVMVKMFGKEYPAKVKLKSRKRKIRLYMTNCQCDIHDGNIIFPNFGVKAGILNFLYRPKSEYDTTQVRRKEAITVILNRLFGWYFKTKNYWIIFEKFCKTAEDNSYYFFDYCMNNLSAKEKKNIYYVIDKRQEGYKNVAKYGKNVVDFMSIKHLLISMTANVAVSSDSKTHLYVWRSKPSLVKNRIKRTPQLFLQHGVTAMKKVHHLFGKTGTTSMTHYVTTTQAEHDIIVENFGYTKDDVPITGFARWDVLKNKENKKDKFILLMPTWRIWLQEVDDEIFTNSDYYKNYTALLSNQTLLDTLEKTDTNLVFYIHPKFADYIKHFSLPESKRLKLIPMGEEPLNELMMKCSMLITDYSSVCWDVLYMDKPVLFYQFDYEMYNKTHGSYIDLEHDLLGDRTTDFNELIELIEYYANHSFKVKDEYQKMINDFFTYRDNSNSERIYNYLKSKGY